MTTILGTYGGKEIRIEDGVVYCPTSALHKSIPIAAMALVVDQASTHWPIVQIASPESQLFWDIFDACLEFSKK
jgi:hypothetical protein